MYGGKYKEDVTEFVAAV